MDFHVAEEITRLHNLQEGRNHNLQEGREVIFM